MDIIASPHCVSGRCAWSAGCTWEPQQCGCSVAAHKQRLIDFRCPWMEDDRLIRISTHRLGFVMRYHRPVFTRISDRKGEMLSGFVECGAALALMKLPSAGLC
ncbi:hypothetical protein CALCODRAFT_342788 [Calocera cornea HHB12733]|uniref:Uncharacterized protein n=1 Tax=Calocera cornea HHB12733 TaxID=1353952 RepID=A0A165EXA5_9BASI|nr:hypothetical protein CALCODRAFT_342788 [Calocera cornea HHB12733]